MLVMVTGQTYGQKWFEQYRDGLRALENGANTEAVRCLRQAIAQRPESKAGARTYGVNFIDYFPYVYRGIAHARLGERSAALKDLEREHAAGEVYNGKSDTKAPALLRSLLAELRTPAPPQKPHSEEPRDGAVDSVYAMAAVELEHGKIVKAKTLLLDVRKRRAAYPGLNEQWTKVQAFELDVRKGIAAFLAGRYPQAVELLTPLAVRGRDHANVQAFLGCSHAALYLLGGGNDADMRTRAIEAFRLVKRIDPTFDLHRPYVSPAIQEMYSAVLAE